MKKTSNFLCKAIVFLAFLLYASSLSAANSTFLNTAHKIFLTKAKHSSSHLLKKQRFTRFSDLSTPDGNKISQHMHKVEYDVSRFERTLPSGKTSTYRAFNRNHNMSAYFTDQGVHMIPNGQREPAWYMEIIFSGYGYDGHLATVQSIQPDSIEASGHRIEYRRGVLTEWYVNSRQGLEHGVILSEPPAGKKGGRIVVEWTVSGSLTPRLDLDGTAIAFGKSKDQTILRYSGLKAWDATGRMLSAKLAVKSAGPNDLLSRISFVVDDTGATYPVMIDPLFTQVKKITAFDGAADDEFGYSISISGDTMAVGSDDTNRDNAGAVYIFERDQGGADQWGFVQKITAFDAAAEDWLGNGVDTSNSVSISGDTVVAGAWADDDNGENSGSVYIFKRDQGGADQWGLVKKITASDGAAGDWFGDSVSISGDTVVVGADGDNGSSGIQFGAAYIFKRDQGGANNWGLVQKITAFDGVEYDYFGFHVSISGDTVVVGSDDNNRNGAGAAYIFKRDQGGADQWGLVKKITASDGAAEDYFGESVSISGDTVVIGSDDTNRNYAGAAYIFKRDQGGVDQWGLVKKITASDGAADDYFGYHVSISGDTVVVGSDDTNRNDAGAAYIFKRNQGGADQWGLVQKITASDGAADDYFSYSVSISGDTVVVAASHDNDNGFKSGSAYVFESKEEATSKAMPWLPLLLLDD